MQEPMYVYYSVTTQKPERVNSVETGKIHVLRISIRSVSAEIIVIFARHST